MSVYRRKSSNGKRSRYYTAEFYYRGRKHRRSGFVDRESARFWLASAENRLRRGAVGYVKPMLRTPVAPLIEEFVAHLEGKGVDAEYSYIAQLRLNVLTADCAWFVIGDVTPITLERWMREPRTFHGKIIGPRTKNQYLRIAQEFARWLVKPRAVLAESPINDVRPLPARYNDEYRRAGTVDEINRLLAACDPQRRIYYLFRIYHSKIRSRTLANLRWGMMRMDAAPPFAQTPPEINKSRREEKHPLRYDIVQQLRRLKRTAKAKADDLVFPDPPTLDDLRADLARAGVPFEYSKGRGRLDYHAMRATLVSLGKHSGLTAFEVMELLGHRDIRTTMKYYNKNSIDPALGAAMEKLPELGKVRSA